MQPRCLTRDSADPIPPTAARLAGRNYTMGEALALAKLEKLCCCTGHLCSSSSEVVQDFFEEVAAEEADPSAAHPLQTALLLLVTSLFI